MFKRFRQEKRQQRGHTTTKPLFFLRLYILTRDLCKQTSCSDVLKRLGRGQRQYVWSIHFNNLAGTAIYCRHYYTGRQMQTNSNVVSDHKESKKGYDFCDAKRQSLGIYPYEEWHNDKPWQVTNKSKRFLKQDSARRLRRQRNMEVRLYA